jgi:hypothetical protein
MTPDQFTAAATAAMEAQMGSQPGRAYAVLMFGAPGIAGAIDNAHLASAANSPGIDSMTQDAILNLVKSAAQGSLVAQLEAKAAPVLGQAGLTADGVAQAAAIIAGTARPSPPTGLSGTVVAE